MVVHDRFTARLAAATAATDSAGEQDAITTRLPGAAEKSHRVRIPGALGRLLLAATLWSVWCPLEMACSEEETTAGQIASEIEEPPITASDRKHWAFRPLTTPSLPPVRHADWMRNPIDAFVLAKMEASNLTPQPPADRRTLIRRLTFQLTGLPPTSQEIESFVADERPDAEQQWIDRLLDSPRFGPHWAQVWLDLARFAETDGFEHDKVRPDAWRYRDWVIRAANEDLPYDRFVALQIAGDELAPQDEQARIATAFCLSGPDMPDINSQDERRHYLLNEMTATTASVFLGLQMGCAQCHDHKFDPISQADFYRLRVFFEPAIQLQRDKSVFHLASTDGPARDVEARLWIRGDWRRPGPAVVAAFPRVANPQAVSTSPAAGRAALAEWLTCRDNPLTARVIVNRLWQFHFGRGLCGTSSDFGYAGEEPTHPELLDWLASELIRSQWSLKRMHRLIVSSATWQQASRCSESATSQQLDAWRRALHEDPENRLWCRYPRRRLSGETLRDAMLAVAGLLNEAGGGPGVRPPLAAELQSTLLKDQWEVSPNEAEHSRRSIYLFARRNLRYPIFDAFDRPDANASCARRHESTTAPQALLMLNSEFSQEIAARLAEKSSTADDDRARLVELFQQTWGRPPTAEESREALAFLAAQDRAPSAAWRDLCLALLNANAFAYLD